MAQQHFYDKVGAEFDKSDFIDSNEVAASKEALASSTIEDKVSTAAIIDWANWLSANGINLKIISSINPAPESIERMTL